jgi:hypothetical protein
MSNGAHNSTGIGEVDFACGVTGTARDPVAEIVFRKGQIWPLPNGKQRIRIRRRQKPKSYRRAFL